MLWYLLNIGIIIVFIVLFLITRNTNKRWSKINDYLGMVTNTVDSVRYGNLTTKMEQIHHPTYQNVTDSINRMVETLNDREHMIIEYQSELMRQNKLLESVINSLSDGILIVNEKGQILRATPKISSWFGVKGAELLGKNVFEYIKIDGDYSFEKLGEERTKNAHIHFSRIQYGAKGEIRHLTFEDKLYGPYFEDLVNVLIDYDMACHVICESSGTMAEDSKTMKDIYLKTLANRS